MRLFDTTTLTLHEFFGKSIPEYAILSHRWEDEEVTFQDLQSHNARRMKARSKIRGCCAQAARDGWKYAWIDSCCIDKSSSSELSEAINSMYQWYEKSRICYVYLSDVTTVPTGRTGDRHESQGSEFRRSKWFTRGWTLQELIAPRSVVFYDCSWREIGTRKYLEDLISEITGIKSRHFAHPREASIAQRMSWASKREVTRIEDHAYSLLGLFNVNMPTLYGEGWKAFWRLQLEIMGSSDDESIFAWNTNRRFHPPLSLFAQRPANFADSGRIVRSKGNNTRPPYHMTNKGLCIEAFLHPTNDESLFVQYIVPIHCSREEITGSPQHLGVLITDGTLRNKAKTDKLEDLHGPWRVGSLAVVNDLAMPHQKPSERTVIYVKQYLDTEEDDRSPGDPTDETSYALAIESLQRYNFTVFKETWHDCSHGPFPIRDIYSYSITSSEQRKIKTHTRVYHNKPCSIVYLHFLSEAYIEDGMMRVDTTGSETPDSFVVVLDVKGTEIKQPHVDILIPDMSLRPQLQGAAVEISLTLPVDFKNRTDRISKVMRSGMSVSVALKRRPDENGHRSYILDITIDPDGNLAWPLRGWYVA